MSSKLPRAPGISWERGGRGGDIGQEEVETTMHKMKKQGDMGRWSASRDDGDGWRRGNQVDGKATERVYAGGNDTEGWMIGLIVPLWKGKGDVHDPGKYRGIALLIVGDGFRRRDQEKTIEGDFGKEHQGFRKGIGIADGTYVLRQIVGMRLNVQGSMALGFVALETAFDTVPREIVMATLRWMGVPEVELRVIVGVHEKTTARVVVGE